MSRLPSSLILPVLFGILLFGEAVYASGSERTRPLDTSTDGELSTSISSGELTVGDILTVMIAVRHSESSKIAFPKLESSWGEWLVRNIRRPAPQPAANGVITETLEIQLAIYKTGDFNVPSLSIELVKADGQKSVLTSNSSKVSVRSVLTSNDETLKDLKPQADITPDYKPFLLMLAALGSAAYLIYLLIRRWKHRAKPVTTVIRDTRTPEEIAREAIRQLLAQKLIEDGHFKIFYLELSEIIKRFLGAKLNIPSLERTTREFTRDLQSTEIAEEQYRLIRDFLENCDLVKFAKYRPASLEIQDAIKQADVIIESSGPSVRALAKPVEVHP